MSKKLAEGIDGLVLDVKTGSGAFMKTMEDSVKLARSLIDTAEAFGKKAIAMITDMNQPLGNYIGNWLEVCESVKILKGETGGDLYELSTRLAGAMIYLGGKASSFEEGTGISKKLIVSGRAYEKFAEITAAQGGDMRYIEHPEKYPRAAFAEKFISLKNGYVSRIDNYMLGMGALELWAGRKTKEDKIDPKAGIIFYAKIGDYVKRGETIAELHSSSKSRIEYVKSMLNNAISFSKETVRKPKLIKKIL